MPGKKGWQLWHHFRGWLVVVADHTLVLPRIDAAGAAVNRADVDGERRRHGAGNGAAVAGAAAAACCLAESSGTGGDAAAPTGGGERAFVRRTHSVDGAVGRPAG